MRFPGPGGGKGPERGARFKLFAEDDVRLFAEDSVWEDARIVDRTLAVGTLSFWLLGTLTFGMLVGTLTFWLLGTLTFGMLVGTLTFGMLVGTFMPPALAGSAPTTTAQRATETLTSFVALILTFLR